MPALPEDCPCRSGALLRWCLLKSCPDCGTENSELNGFCSKCSAALPRRLNVSSAPVEPRQEKQRTSDAEPSDTEKLIKRAESHRSKLNGQMLSHRCGLAGALSALLPGLGQIYTGDIIKGMAMVASWVVGGFFYGRWIVTSISARSELYLWTDRSDLGLSHFLVGLVFVGFWIYAIVDAASAPERLR
ncbi:MAG: hypothetical protein ACOX7D_03550 [Alphaproteobacteria bacterium]